MTLSTTIVSNSVEFTLQHIVFTLPLHVTVLSPYTSTKHSDTTEHYNEEYEQLA